MNNIAVNEPAGSIPSTIPSSSINNDVIVSTTTTSASIAQNLPSSEHVLASPVAHKPKTKKAKKAPRDPNEPKKNLTSYVLFSNYIRPIIRERMVSSYLVLNFFKLANLRDCVL